MNKALQTIIIVVTCAVVAPAFAGGVKYTNDDGDWVKLGGRIQLQYHSVDPAVGQSSDELLFRRIRPYIEGSIHEDWNGKFQWDMGKGDVELKDAYFAYGGIEGVTILIGNATIPFSREKLTSSKTQQLIENTFVGDHNYGAPDRQVGIHLSGGLSDDMLTWAVSAAKGAVDPSNKKLDFDSTISLNKGDDWLEGDMVGGRLEFFPMGSFKHAQGDFDGEFKAALAVGAFMWANDDDRVNEIEEGDTSVDVDDVAGFEVSAAIRGGGLSVDAEYNSFDSQLRGGTAGVDGIYRNGETTLENMSVEGGFMVVPERVELVGGYQVQDADGYADEWTRTSVGLNYFVHKHDVKYQLTYQMGESVDGKVGNDVDELFVQAQYVF